jgi:hypothetical protein
MTVSTASIALLALLAGTPAGAPPPAGTAPAAGAAPNSASLTIVVKDGGTHVENKGPTLVSVTPNDGRAQQVGPGDKAEFTSDGAQAKLQAPSLLTPNDKERLRVKPTEKGLGPVLLTWAPVAGAREYEVEFQVDGKRQSLKVQLPKATLPPLPPGKVLWAVRSVADGATSEYGVQRWFELQPEQLKLDVSSQGFK